MARPRKLDRKVPVKSHKEKTIDSNLVHDLASICCTYGEIARICKCSIDTLERHYRDLIDDGICHGNESLRRAQYKLAMSGDRTMLIWLGKQRLGQREPIGEDKDKVIQEIKVTLHPSLITNDTPPPIGLPAAPMAGEVQSGHGESKTWISTLG